MNAAPGPAAGAGLRLYARAMATVAIVGVSALVLSLAVFVAAAFLQDRTLATAGLWLIAVCAVCQAAPFAGKVWWALRLGRWTTGKGQPVWRHERPGRYWSSTALHAALAVLPLTAAVLLVWSILSPMTGP